MRFFQIFLVFLILVPSIPSRVGSVKVFLDVRLNPWKMGYPLFVRGCSLIHLLHLALHLNKQTNKVFKRYEFSKNLESVGQRAANLFVCLFVCLGGGQGEADELNCNPLQRVGIPFFRDLASRPWTLLLLIPPRWYWGGIGMRKTRIKSGKNLI